MGDRGGEMRGGVCGKTHTHTLSLPSLSLSLSLARSLTYGQDTSKHIIVSTSTVIKNAEEKLIRRETIAYHLDLCMQQRLECVPLLE